MVQSDAGSVERYLEELDEIWRPTAERLRAACLEGLVGYEEQMAYGMPAYSRDGQMEIAFAKQLRYLSFYVTKRGVLDAHREALTGLKLGKGCIRYTSPSKIDWQVVDQLLADTTLSSEQPC